MTDRKAITLTHYERGPMQVAVWDEATWWMRKRQWTCPDDPELGTFEDEDFDESKDQIEVALIQPRDDRSYSDITERYNLDRNSGMSED